MNCLEYLTFFLKSPRKNVESKLRCIISALLNYDMVSNFSAVYQG